MGIELKRGLTPKGLRQAEVEYYLWAGCSMFPFVQIITDMQVGGAAFFRIGSSPAGLASQKDECLFTLLLCKKQHAIRTTNQDVACKTQSF